MGKNIIKKNKKYVINMVKGLFRRDVKKKHIVSKVIEKDGKYFVEIPSLWSVDVEYVVVYKVNRVDSLFGIKFKRKK